VPRINRPSYGQQLWRQTLARTGARVGFMWIGTLVIVAVLAPLLANSLPILMSRDGVISSPALSHFSMADWCALTTGLVGIVGWLCGLRGKTLMWSLTISVAVSLLGALTLTKPPALTVYEEYRQLERNDELQWVVRAPIPYSPKDYLRDAGDTGLEAPLASADRTHFAGTDELGADAASRLIHATRVALGIGLIATSIAMVIGVLLGGLMGYFSGIVDLIGMRLVEIFEAVPTLFLLLTFVAFFGRSLYLMMVIIGITGWTGYARFVRAEFLRLREQDFVQAAIASGLPLRSILFRHMLPNGIAPVLVAASFGIASAILAEATLSFLGLGLVDDPSWGQMLNQAVRSSTFNWWMALFPGGAIFATVFAYNLIGESMRDAFDPRLQTHHTGKK
jgi:peptide/nickel transport system permease protein